MSKERNVADVMGEIKEEQNKRLEAELEKKREEQLNKQLEVEASEEIEKIEEVFEEDNFDEKTSKEKSPKERPSKKKSPKERLSREKSPKEKSSKERYSEEKVSKEKVSEAETSKKRSEKVNIYEEILSGNKAPSPKDIEEEPYEEDEDEIKAKKRLEREKRRDIRRSKWIEIEPTVTKVLRKVIVAVAVVGVIVAAILYNLPGKRFDRNIAKADELSLKGNFSEAIQKYNNALKIDDTSIETYLGILNAKEAENAEDLKGVFAETINHFMTFDDETKLKNRALITEYVLHESTIFADDIDERLNILEKGFELTNGSEDIKRLITECVNELVTQYRNEGRFEDAVKLLKRFEEKTDIDNAELIAAIDKEKNTYELKKTLLSKVYDALKDYEEALIDNKEPDPFTYNFSKIMEIDGSEEANSLANSKALDRYIYVPSENYNSGSGVGAGLYTYSIDYETVEGDIITAYSFYVGEYKDGLRDGKGIMFTRTGEYSFVMYAGSFKEDTPQGLGTRYVKNDDGAMYVFTKYTGNWENNLAEGTIEIVQKNSEYMGVTFKGTAQLSHGKGEVVPTESEEYVVQNLRSENLISVLESDTEGYALMLAFWQRSNDVLSATGVKGEQ